MNAVKHFAQQAVAMARPGSERHYRRGISLGRDIKKSLPGQPAVIFDVGAHYGESLHVFTKWFPDARIYCFEPGSEAFARLRMRAGANPRVICTNVALGDYTGEADIYIRRGSENSSLMDYSGQHQAEAVIRTEQISVTTIDKYVSEQAIRRIDFLKIDTEGVDLKVLLGGSAMFEDRSIGIVQVEASMTPENTKHVPYRDFENFFLDHKYRLFGIYDQVSEWTTDRPFLRRCNLVFISPDIARI